MAALGPRVLPLLDLVAARAARRRRAAQPGGRALLPPPGRGAARARHRAGGDALPLGPPAGAAGRRRLGQPRHRRALRRVRAAHGARARRPRAHAGSRTTSRGWSTFPGHAAGPLRARRARLADGAGRQPPPAALPRARPRRRSRASVGITLNLSPVHPAAPGEEEAARLYDGHLNRWFLDPVLRGAYPRGRARALRAPRRARSTRSATATSSVIARPIDFLGVNYYFPSRVRADASAQPLGVGLRRRRRRR